MKFRDDNVYKKENTEALKQHGTYTGLVRVISVSEINNEVNWSMHTTIEIYSLCCKNHHRTNRSHVRQETATDKATRSDCSSNVVQSIPWAKLGKVGQNRNTLMMQKVRDKIY